MDKRDTLGTSQVASAPVPPLKHRKESDAERKYMKRKEGGKLLFGEVRSLLQESLANPVSDIPGGFSAWKA